MKSCPYCAEAIQEAAVKCRHCGEWLDPNSRPPWAVDLAEIGRKLCEAVDARMEGPTGETQAEPPGLGVPMPQPERSWDEQTDPDLPALPRTPTSLFGGAPSQDLDVQPPSDDADAAAAAAAAARTLDRPQAPAEGDGHDSWTAPAWLARPRAPGQRAPLEPPPPPPPSTPVQPDEMATADGETATLKELALRMERIKASAAVVRDALRDTDADAPRAEPVAQPGPPPPEPERAVRPPRREPPSPAAELAAGFFGDADASTADSLAADGSLTSTGDGFGSMVGPAPRPIPWAPIIVGGVVVAAIGIYTFRNQLFDQPIQPEAQQAAVPEGVVAKEAAPQAPTVDAATKAGEGKLVQPDSTASGTEPPAEDDAKAADEAGEEAPTVLDPESLEKLDEARKLYKGQKLKKAAGLLGEILEEHPRQGEALLLMAQVQLEEAEFDSSLDTASTCVEVDPQLADCWLTIGVLQQNRKDKEAAVAAYEKYLALAPEGNYARDVRTQLKRLSR